ncbi:TFIIB-type zinc ribbon-containing protein [Nocardioides sp. zg-1228]|uniref:TFIIB-type zinc ribbon-containing protein n=1 Tax=Nocardioides sp. zg-1228 TaxID=2763008 RepID=UPI0016427472|nr:TFIIB-type zinc ribbon-containing protein [Nocardioides sp. zg-1228]MBC2934670.1 TFIIB-type zinc ribbon-containing protein [Nocardioides sp. zg-1228]QSF55989.1 TFIIB-type zinc ribbon-containing protein [Nocardioides sp. zg-1228]
MTQDAPPPRDPDAPVFDGPPLPLEEELAAARADPEPGPDIQTVNDSLADGINRCPKCGSTDVQLRASTGMLVCLFCRHQWEESRVEEALGLGEGIDELEGTVIAGGAGHIAADAAAQVTLKCGGCGAEVVVDTAHTMNARCHWCRHTLNVNQQTPNGAVPDAVLPFRLTHAEAVERIREFAGKRRLFAHPRFKAEFVPENVLGVYLPYLVIDARADTAYVGEGEVQTRRWTEKSGDNDVTYYAADVYRVRRSVSFTVDDLTVEGAAARASSDSSTTNNIINTILPFDTKNAVRWNASYLVGYTSEKRDLDVDDLRPVLEDQLLSIGRAQVHDSLSKFDRGVRWEQEKVDVGGSRWISMYLPVWLYSYYQENTKVLHYIAVNGRTGETMGSVPVSQWRLIAAALTVGTVLEGAAGALLVAMS